MRVSARTILVSRFSTTKALRVSRGIAILFLGPSAL